MITENALIKACLSALIPDKWRRDQRHSQTAMDMYPYWGINLCCYNLLIYFKVFFGFVRLFLLIQFQLAEHFSMGSDCVLLGTLSISGYIFDVYNSGRKVVVVLLACTGWRPGIATPYPTRYKTPSMTKNYPSPNVTRLRRWRTTDLVYPDSSMHKDIFQWNCRSLRTQSS